MWAVLSAIATIAGGLAGFYGGREGLIQEIRETNERLLRIELRLDATALVALENTGRERVVGPLLADTARVRR